MIFISENLSYFVHTKVTFKLLIVKRFSKFIALKTIKKEKE